MIIKQLQQLGETFAPQTVAEAVLVKYKGNVERLDLTLYRKIESVSSTDLTVTKEGLSVVIVHANNIAPNQAPSPALIQFDEHGHIVNTEPAKTLKISINENKYIEYDGSQEMELKLGDDFENRNERVQIHWNTLI